MLGGVWGGGGGGGCGKVWGGVGVRRGLCVGEVGGGAGRGGVGVGGG